MKQKHKHKLTEAQVSEIVQMALSDHVAFSDIELQYGLKGARGCNSYATNPEDRFVSQLAQEGCGIREAQGTLQIGSNEKDLATL